MIYLLSKLNGWSYQAETWATPIHFNIAAHPLLLFNRVQFSDLTDRSIRKCKNLHQALNFSQLVCLVKRLDYFKLTTPEQVLYCNFFHAILEHIFSSSFVLLKRSSDWKEFHPSAPKFFKPNLDRSVQLGTTKIGSAISCYSLSVAD